jgi:enoyl-CoA hydratase/carnithine racemase
VGDQTPIVERDGAIATLTLNPPKPLNALDRVTRRERASVLDASRPTTLRAW